MTKRTAASSQAEITAAEANGGHVVTDDDVNSVGARRLLTSQMLRLLAGQSTDALSDESNWQSGVCVGGRRSDLHVCLWHIVISARRHFLNTYVI